MKAHGGVVVSTALIGSFSTILPPTRITTNDDIHESSKSCVPTSNTVHICNCYYLHICVWRNVCRVFPTYELRLNTPADVRVEATSYVIRSQTNQRHGYSIFIQQLTPVVMRYSTFLLLWNKKVHALSDAKLGGPQNRTGSGEEEPDSIQSESTAIPDELSRILNVHFNIILPPISKSNQDIKMLPILREGTKDGKKNGITRTKISYFFCTLNNIQYVSLVRYLAMPFLLS
jgi:hypothetical protein